MHNSKPVNINRSTLVPNHLEISLSGKEADFVHNRIESDLAIYPLGNFATNSDLTRNTLPTNKPMLKQKNTNNTGPACDEKIAMSTQVCKFIGIRA